MSDIHLRLGNEPTKASNKSISGFPRFWDAEVMKSSKGSRSSGLTRNRQTSRRRRPQWSPPITDPFGVLNQYAEQKNPGLATDEDMQAVKAKLCEPTVERMTTANTHSPTGSLTAVPSHETHATSSPTADRKDQWIQQFRAEHDSPPNYNDTRYVHRGGDSIAGLAELPDESTVNWRITSQERSEDPWPHLRPDHDPFFGPAITGPAAPLLSAPSPPTSSRWPSSHGSTRTPDTSGSIHSTQSMRVAKQLLAASARPRGQSGRHSTGSVSQREDSDLYGPGK